MSISFSCEVLVCSVLYFVVQSVDVFESFVTSNNNLFNTLSCSSTLSFLIFMCKLVSTVKFVFYSCTCTVTLLIVL